MYLNTVYQKCMNWKYCLLFQLLVFCKPVVFQCMFNENELFMQKKINAI